MSQRGGAQTRSAVRPQLGRRSSTTSWNTMHIAIMPWTPPEITDAAFDKMLVELQQLEAAYPELVTAHSYTQRVGGYVSPQFQSVTHMARMYSMDDAMNLEELDEWLDRTEAALGAGQAAYTCELKIDGLGVALTYENGLCARGHPW